MIIYVISNEKRQYVTKPGTGSGGWTRDLGRAWQFEENARERELWNLAQLSEAVEHKLMWGNDSIKPKEFIPSAAYSVRQTINTLTDKLLKITKHELVEENGTIYGLLSPGQVMEDGPMTLAWPGL